MPFLSKTGDRLGTPGRAEGQPPGIWGERKTRAPPAVAEPGEGFVGVVAATK